MMITGLVIAAVIVLLSLPHGVSIADGLHVARAFGRLRVFTAYEYLETRFDAKTRALAALLFLIQRGLAAGLTIYAPAIILSVLLGLNLHVTNLLMG